jgi:hypothetical protein
VINSSIAIYACPNGFECNFSVFKISTNRAPSAVMSSTFHAPLYISSAQNTSAEGTTKISQLKWSKRELSLSPNKA